MKNTNKKTPPAKRFESLSSDTISQRRKNATGLVRRSLVAWTAIGLALLGSEGTASAVAITGSEELEALQQSETSLVHHYTFAPTAINDKKGSDNLRIETYSNAYSFEDNTLSLAGGSMWCANPQLPDNFTMEFLVRPSTLNTSGDRQIFSALSQPANRFYIIQNGNKFNLTIGETNTAINLFTGINAGSAYYIVLNFTYFDPTPLAGDDAIYTVDAWIGEAGVDNLTKVLTSKVFTLTDTAVIPTAGGFRIGAGANYSAANAWSGDLDSIALYNSTLAESTVIDHYAAVPEPSTFGLAGAGLMMLGLLQRQRARNRVFGRVA